MCIISTKVWF